VYLNNIFPEYYRNFVCTCLNNKSYNTRIHKIWNIMKTILLFRITYYYEVSTKIETVINLRFLNLKPQRL